MRELIQVAPLLGIHLESGELPDAVAEAINNEQSGPIEIERKVWLLMFERMRISIEYKTVVSFG